MNRVAFSTSGGVGDELVKVVTKDSATSMGPVVGIPTPPKRGCGRLRYIQGSVVAMLDIGKALIPCVRVL